MRRVFTGVLAVSLFYPALSFAETTIRVLSINREGGIPDLYRKTAADFEAANPGVKVAIEFMEDEAFKQKLPTLLQSAESPDLFYSWGGGDLKQQASQGFVKDISGNIDQAWRSELSAGGLSALSDGTRTFGVPEVSAGVVIWYNKDLAAKAGIDPETIKTWDDFIGQVQKVKAQGLTPIVVGGQDKWPLHFYYAMLALRIMGHEGIAASAAGENGGFNNADWIRAGTEFKKLIDTQPFQPGFMGVKYDQAAGLWGDGGAVFHLMGDWDLTTQKGAATKGGLTDDQLGVIPFPVVSDGRGEASETFGGASGFVVGSKARPETVDFLKFFLSANVQKEGAAQGFYIPAAPSAVSQVKSPLVREIADMLARSTYHQLFLDQALGASLGGVVNDVAAQLASGDITPEEAAEALEEARQFQ